MAGCCTQLYTEFANVLRNELKPIYTCTESQGTQNMPGKFLFIKLNIRLEDKDGVLPPVFFSVPFKENIKKNEPTNFMDIVSLTVAEQFDDTSIQEHINDIYQTKEYDMFYDSLYSTNMLVDSSQSSETVLEEFMFELNYLLNGTDFLFVLKDSRSEIVWTSRWKFSSMPYFSLSLERALECLVKSQGSNINMENEQSGIQQDVDKSINYAQPVTQSLFCFVDEFVSEIFFAAAKLIEKKGMDTSDSNRDLWQYYNFFTLASLYTSMVSEQFRLYLQEREISRFTRVNVEFEESTICERCCYYGQHGILLVTFPGDPCFAIAIPNFKSVPSTIQKTTWHRISQVSFSSLWNSVFFWVFTAKEYIMKRFSTLLAPSISGQLPNTTSVSKDSDSKDSTINESSNGQTKVSSFQEPTNTTANENKQTKKSIKKVFVFLFSGLSILTICIVILYFRCQDKQ